jgi:hypothetical protein
MRDAKPDWTAPGVYGVGGWSAGAGAGGRRLLDRHAGVDGTGPNTVSAGDGVALRMTYHPRARIFGKSTNTAFTADGPTLDFGPGWSARYSEGDAYRISEPHNYLTHDEFPVDEPVWLRPDDVAQGKDIVVDAASTGSPTRCRNPERK